MSLCCSEETSCWVNSDATDMVDRDNVTPVILQNGCDCSAFFNPSVENRSPLLLSDCISAILTVLELSSSEDELLCIDLGNEDVLVVGVMNALHLIAADATSSAVSE